MKRNYDTYRFTPKEWFLYLSESLAICGGINYLFYKNWWVFLGMLPVPFLFLRYKRKDCKKQRRKRLNYQFKDALSSLSVALQAGYSVENAVYACTRDLEKLYKPGEDILEEFHYMEAQLQVSVPVEELFLDLGNRCKVEDIANFASVFATAKRTGGDMVAILQKTARILGDKSDVKKEIEATVAGKKSEQWIMSMMPFGIILYMQITSPGFLQVLYGNAFGVVTMTVCLAIYFLAYWMGKKIVDIEV